MRFLSLVLFALLGFAGVSHAADFPSKLIKIVVPASPGGPLDILGRIYAEEIKTRWGQSAILEHRPGANAMIGTTYVARAAPDGYTLLLTSVNHVINGAVNKNLPFDPISDFSAVAIVCQAPLVLVSNPAVPVKTMGEFVAFAEHENGKINYSSPGAGSANHLAMEALKVATGIDAAHVAYLGSAPAVLAVVSGEVQVYFSNLIGAAPFLQSGKLRALGVTSPTRVAALPDVPAIGETIKDYSLISWYGLLAPAGVSDEIVEKLHGLVEDVGKREDFRQKLVAVGVEPASMSVAAFRSFMTAEAEKWKKIAGEADVKLN